MLLAKLVGAVRRHRMLSSGDRVLLACSGGPDSVALLDALGRLSGRFGVTIEVATVNHGLREEAARECAWVERLAAERGLGCHVLRVKVARPSQDAARAARLEGLVACARRRGCNRIALAHTRSDQAETVLMRVVRGTGLRGLAGIPPVRGPFIRPLVEVSHEEVEEYLREQRLVCVRDPTNVDRRYLRVRVRLDVMPLLRRENPRLEEALAELATTVRAEVEADERAPVRRAHLRALEGLLQAPGGTRALDLGGGRVAEVRVGPRRQPTMPVEVVVPGPGRHEIGALGVALVLEPGGQGARLDFKALRFPLICRTRRPGDRIRLAMGTRKVSDVLIDAKVPRIERDRVLLLCDRARVLWVAGVTQATGTQPRGRQFLAARVESLST